MRIRSKHLCFLILAMSTTFGWYGASSPQATNVDPVTCDPAVSCSTVADNRLWHLDRIDQGSASPNNTFNYCNDGTGVTVYVVDGGVNKHHQEFGPNGARVLTGYNATGDGIPANDPCYGFADVPPTEFATTLADEYRNERFSVGHGTAAASVLGGSRVGVAKNVTIVPVKVIRCDKYSARPRISSRAYQLGETMYVPYGTNGSTLGGIYRAVKAGTTAPSTNPNDWPRNDYVTIKTDGTAEFKLVPSTEYNDPQADSYMVAGLNWIVEQTENASGPSIVSISTGRLPSTPLWALDANNPNTVEGAIDRLLENGVTVVVSANNQNGNACDTIPARDSRVNPNNPLGTDGVITVGGAMLLNRPWPTNAPSGVDPANPLIAGTSERKGTEVAYDRTKAVRDARWICGPGDSSEVCFNEDAEASGDTSTEGYHGYQGGSNAGACVTLFAPAKNIVVAAVDAANAYRDPRIRGGHASGTSWSAPMVAGAAALILQDHPTYTPAQVEAVLLAQTVEGLLDPATVGSFDSNGNPVQGTPNRLLQLGNVRITDHQPNVTPSAPGVMLSVGATGSGLSYQWFKVHTDFDVTATRGAYYDAVTPANGSSDLVGTATTHTVTQAGRYWARVTGSCGLDESTIITLGAGSFCATTVSSNPVTFAATAQTGKTITVTSQCAWSAISNDTWITITGGASGSGNGTVTYSLAVNTTGEQRTGTIAVGLSTFTVIQKPYVRGDFDADSKTDLLWQHATTEQVYLWYMDGVSHTGSANVNSAGTGWKIVGTHDFDADGDSDVLWQNATTNQAYIWYMNGNAYVSGANMNNAGSGWWVSSVADFNGDDRPDILWENSSTSQMYLWYMNGNQKIGEANVNHAGSGWSAAGTGDFDNDGDPDLLWHKQSTGDNKIWLMNGNANTSEQTLPAAGTGWRIAAVGNYDTDGIDDDIVFQYISTGQNYVWFISNAQKSGESNMNSAGNADWKVAAPK